MPNNPKKTLHIFPFSMIVTGDILLQLTSIMIRDAFITPNNSTVENPYHLKHTIESG